MQPNQTAVDLNEPDNIMSSQFDTPKKNREDDGKFRSGDGLVSPTIDIQRAQRNVDIEKNNEAIFLIE